MKTQKMFTIDIELLDKLKELNASALINRLLTDHFGDLKAKKQDNSGMIIESVKEKMGDDADLEKMAVFLDKLSTIGDYTEYDQGVKEGKWKGVTEYARISLGLNK